MFTLIVDDDISLRLHDMYKVEDFFDLIMRNKDFIGRFLGWAKYYNDINDAIGYILDTRKKFGEGNFYGTQLYYRGQIAGSIGLIIKNKTAGKAEIGYWLGEEFTGKGIITRAARALLDYAFGTLNLHKVIIRCEQSNNASCAIAERLGFVQEGTLFEEVLDGETYRTMRLFRMMAQDWTIQHENLEFAKRLGDGLELRLFRPDQANILFSLVDANREHLRKWMGWVDSTTSSDVTRGAIERWLKKYGDNNGVVCGIWLDGTLVGVVDYHYWDLRHMRTEIGYWLAKNATGKGVVTRSVACLIDYAFDVMAMHRIEIQCATNNGASCAIAERLDFTLEGVKRRGQYLNEHFVDLNNYSLLAHEWDTR